MNGYTPGPWKVSALGSGLLIENAAGYVIARISVLLAYRRQHRANARLIAAAPELLQALQSLSEYVYRDMESNAPNWAPMDVPEYAAASAALAKAKWGAA